MFRGAFGVLGCPGTEARIEVNASVGDVTPKYNAIYKWVTTSHFRVAEAQKGYSKKGVEEFNFCLFF